MNRERFIKPKIDKYIQLYSKKAKIEDANQVLVLRGIDIVNAGEGYTSLTATIPAPTTGTQATAQLQVNNGKITSAVLTNVGNGYTSLPEITLIEQPTSSVKAIEILDKGLGYTTAPIISIGYPSTIRKAVITATFAPIGESNDYQLSNLTIVDGGTGYTAGAPTIIINSSNNSVNDVKANVTLYVSNGYVSSFSIISRGLYTSDVSNPTIVSEPPLTNAIATATCTIDAEGSINSITITNGGSAYTSTPIISVQGTSTRIANLKAYRNGINGKLNLTYRYEPIQVFKYTWDLDSALSINENALLQIVERQFTNIPIGDANKLISIRIHDIDSQAVVNTRNLGLNTDFNGGLLLDIGKPDRVLNNDIKLEINQQVINRITLSLNHDISSTTGLNYNTEFVIVLKISEKEPSLIEYGTLNNINFLQ